MHKEKSFFAISRIKQENIWHNWKWNIIWWYLSDSFLFHEDYCCLEHRILNMKTTRNNILMNFVVRSKGYLVVYAYELSLIFLSSWTCVLGSHFLCWISGLVPLNTWLISSWEKKITVVTSSATDKMTGIFTQNDNFDNFGWKSYNFLHLLK